MPRLIGSLKYDFEESLLNVYLDIMIQCCHKHIPNNVEPYVGIIKEILKLTL